MELLGVDLVHDMPNLLAMVTDILNKKHSLLIIYRDRTLTIFRQLSVCVWGGGGVLCINVKVINISYK